MPIRINFLAEQQEAEEARRRDPVKLAAMGAGLLVALMGVWCGYNYSRVSASAGMVSQRKDDLAKLEKTSKVVEANLKTIDESRKRFDALNSYTTNRFLWGNTLNALQLLAVDHIKLTRVRIGQRYVLSEPTPPKKDGTGKVIAAGKPGQATESISLTIDGLDEGAGNEQNYNKYITAIANSPYFKENLRKENPVTLREITKSVDKNDPNKVVYRFSLECAFPDKVR